MKTFTGLSLMMLLLLAATMSAMPQRRQLKSQRQVEYASTPYPAAGYRPRIAFDLPSEQQPKLEEPLATTTATLEDFGSTETQSTTELEVEAVQQQQQQEVEANARTPANTYGAPESNPEDTVEVVAQVPAKDFQPPVREAVEDFAAVAIDGFAAEQQPVADVPALDQAETPLSNDEEPLTSTELELKSAATPASSYGAPNTPASSYGAPELEESDNELEVDESQVELVEEAEQELNDAALGLSSGRLILLPFNAANTQFGRLILAVEQPKQQLGRQRQRLRSERLRRN